MEYKRLTERASFDKSVILVKEFDKWKDYVEFSNLHALEEYKNILNRLAELEKARIIEEMAKDLEEIEKDAGQRLINETFAYVKEHHKYNPKKDYSLAHTKTIYELTAEEMIKRGYQKVKDSIILSREEYERLKGKRQSCNCEALIKQASKETAEKILTKLQPYIGGWVLFKELENEYGVKIDIKE